MPSRPNGALSNCDVTVATALVAAAVSVDRNDREKGEDDDDNDDSEKERDEDGDEAAAADSRGSAADMVSVTAAAATTTTIRIDHDQLYRLRVFHILPTNGQVSGGVVTHATGGQQQLIGRPIAYTAMIAPAWRAGRDRARPVRRRR